MSDANQYEQQMLDLINSDRAAAGLNPLVFNGDLNEASEDHSAWMLETDRFSHRGENGSTSRQRIEDSGYELEGRWLIGENIAWVDEQGENGLPDEVVRLHTNLMNSPEHRANLLNPDLKEIGIGIETGDFVDEGRNVDAVFATQNFGTTSANTVVLPVVAAPVAVVTEVAVQQAEVPTEIRGNVEAQTETFDGPGFDALQFLADRDVSVSTQNDSEATSGFTSTEQTTVSRVDASATASQANGPSVDVEGEGNFSGGSTATVNGISETEMASGPSPVFEQPEIDAAPVAEESEPLPVETIADAAPTSATFDFDEFILGLQEDADFETMRITGSGDATATARWVDGPSVVSEGGGNFGGSGTVMVGGMIHAKVVFGSSPAPAMAETDIEGMVATEEDALLVEFLLMQSNAEFEGFAPVFDNSQTGSTFDVPDAFAELSVNTFDEFVF